MHLPEPTLIGWKETVDLPDWGISHLVAKSDTGARRSSLDATDIRRVDDGFVQFNLMLHRRDRSRFVPIRARISHVGHVKSSNGLKAERFYVRTRLSIGGQTFPAELSLSDRAGMTCRMLLGRRALEGRFWVDAASRYRVRDRLATRVVPVQTR
jgi:hypothetical protein